MAKKSFKDNPAMQFISTPIGDNADDKHDEYNASTASHTHRPQERKSKRLNLLLPPSLLESLAKVAHMKRSSVNDLINVLLKDYVASEAEAIAKYEEIFGSEGK